MDDKETSDSTIHTTRRQALQMHTSTADYRIRRKFLCPCQHLIFRLLSMTIIISQDDNDIKHCADLVAWQKILQTASTPRSLVIEPLYVIIMPVVSLWYAIGWSLKVLVSLVFSCGFSSPSMIPLFIALALASVFLCWERERTFDSVSFSFCLFPQVGVWDLDWFPIIACYRWLCASCLANSRFLYPFFALGKQNSVLFHRSSPTNRPLGTKCCLELSFRVDTSHGIQTACDNDLLLYSPLPVPAAILSLALFAFFRFCFGKACVPSSTVRCWVSPKQNVVYFSFVL